MQGIDELAELLKAAKAVEGPFRWREKAGKRTEPQPTDILEQRLSLAVGGVTLEGVELSATAYQFRPERNVTIQLLAIHRLKPYPFIRAEWRSTPHTNRKRPNSPLHMTQCGETHLHCLHLNAHDGWPGILTNGDNLPVARPLSGLESFHDFVDFVSDEFGIYNLREIGVPPWQSMVIPR